MVEGIVAYILALLIGLAAGLFFLWWVKEHG